MIQVYRILGLTRSRRSPDNGKLARSYRIANFARGIFTS